MLIKQSGTDVLPNGRPFSRREKGGNEAERRSVGKEGVKGVERSLARVD